MLLSVRTEEKQLKTPCSPGIVQHVKQTTDKHHETQQERSSINFTFTAFCTNYTLLHVPCTWLSYPSKYFQQYTIVGPRLSLRTIRDMIRSYSEELLTHRSNPRWSITPCRLSATAYSIHSQLPSTLEAVSPSATWGRAMPRCRDPLIASQA